MGAKLQVRVAVDEMFKAVTDRPLNSKNFTIFYTIFT